MEPNDRGISYEEGKMKEGEKEKRKGRDSLNIRIITIIVSDFLD